MTPPRVVALRAEHVASALGIDEPAPRLSWRLEGAGSATGYEIEVCRDLETAPEICAVAAVGAQALVPWPARGLAPRERAVVRVRTTNDHLVGDWSDELVVERGLTRDAWSAPWVSPSVAASSEGPRPAFLLRAEYDRPEGARRVRLYLAAHGVYQLEHDGIRVDDTELAPGWSSFGHRLRYQTFDLDQASAGVHALGVWLADGWYRGRLGFNGGLWDVYGRDIALRAQLEVMHEDGSVVQVPLSWTWSPAPITATGLYEGERHDARLEQDGWSAPGFDGGAWNHAAVLDDAAFGAALEGPVGPPVRCVEEIRPVAVDWRPDGRVRLDFGQNVSGRLRFTATANRGHVVRLHHAEVLEDDALAVRPLRTASSVDEYVFAGSGTESWEPRFTIHGFRYAEVEGWPADAPVSVVARVIHSDMQRAGWFTSSHALLNRLHENVVWSMRDNFVDLPTDCPQRDERLGWTGDIQVFAPAAAFLFDCTGVLRSWLRDVAAEQAADGTMRNFHPWLECGFPSAPAAAWGDAAVIVPWTLYERTGDVQVLRDQAGSMAAWVDQVDALTGGTGLWDASFQLGDWLDPAAPPDRPGDSGTDRHLVATAYHARSARLTAQAFDVLGDPERAARYAQVADRALAAFRREYVAPSGRIVSDTVTALSVALEFGLLADDEQRAIAGRRLVELVRANDHRIATGFVGTPLVCDALVRVGAVDTAYHLLLQTECPSWLYPVTMGATTVWERWDSMLPDGSVNPGEMTSFNHYALGAVADFLHRVVGGLAPSEPGYRRVLVAPQPGGGLTSGGARHLSPYGEIDVHWERTGATVSVTATLPEGVEGEIVLPGDAARHRIVAGTTTLTGSFRPASEDPSRPRLWNVHSPEDRIEMERAGVVA
ncbi:family 78 glycoside hydrolase catalytic domain [Luteimicrobium subarcticum]|uniref:alpha-L-rhamnosidase n=1 Tax=Luteimicrobium subarcticum TaxID=620910 RepID=A0A2M8WJT5_9MICO|nr:family 78 glycoside hydrolase catalytic domain [Luteimicrobium subarcticum]PJI91156.1 alpha-L-rhamnosidase [Luteimicrobium subarcticum]